MTRTITPVQCKMARAGLGWTLDQLVEIGNNSGSPVGRATIARFENGDAIKPVTAERLRIAFEAAGFRFVDEGEHAGAVYDTRKAT